MKSLNFNRPEHAFCWRVDLLNFGLFDAAGVLYHANYFHVFESARERLLIEHNLPYSHFAEKNQHLALTKSEQNFHHPIFYGKPVTVYIWTYELKRTSFSLAYEVFSTPPAQPTSGTQQPVRVHSALISQVFIAMQNGVFHPHRLPEELYHILEELR